MSNRDSLRALSRKMPPVEEVAATMRLLNDSPDRTAAIVAASLLESTLERILISRFKDQSKALLPRLFQNRGPLSDFNSKILVAQAFGILSLPMAEGFQTVRHIRNVFAHARVDVTFDTREISEEVERHPVLVAMRATSRKAKLDVLGKTKGKSAYLLMIEIMLILSDDEYGRISYPTNTSPSPDMHDKS